MAGLDGAQSQTCEDTAPVAGPFSRVEQFAKVFHPEIPWLEFDDRDEA